MSMNYHEDTALLIDKMCQLVERKLYTPDRDLAAEKLLQTYDLFDLPRPKRVVWIEDFFDKGYQESARSASSAWSARSARSASSASSASSAWSAWSASSARSAWSAWSASSARSAWSARSASSAWSARSARSASSASSARSASSALDYDFDWFTYAYEFALENSDAVNESDQKYLAYSKLLLDAIEAGAGYRVEWDDTLYIVPPPLRRLDDDNRFHSDQLPAIEWSDSKFYYLHGEQFDERLWRKIVEQKMTVKDVMGIEDADQRVMAWSMLRPDRLLKGMGAKLVDTGIKGTKLYQVDNFAKAIGVSEGEIEEDTTEYCMTMTCPSTGREFLEWIDPAVGKQRNAELCQATAFGVELDQWLSVGEEA